MKRGQAARLAAVDLETEVDRDPAIAVADWDARAPRQGRPVSEPVVTTLLAAADVALLVIVGGLAFGVEEPAIDWRLAGLVVLLGGLLALNFLRLSGAHRFATLALPGGSVGRALAGWLLAIATLLAVTPLLEPITATDGPWMALWFALGAAALVALRLLLCQRVRRWQRAGRVGEVAAVVGAGPVAQRLLRGLNATANGSTAPRIIGVYDDEARSLPRRCMGHAILGSVDDLVRDVRRYGIDTVIVALPLQAEHRLVDTLNRLTVVPVDVKLCPGEFGLRLGRVRASHLGDHTVLDVVERPLRDWQWVAKTIEDLLLGTLILLAIAPVMLAIALLIKLDSPGPVLFRQKRYGFNNELIEVLKFRTMRHEQGDVRGEQLTRRGDPRITRVGALLRRTSLDELPQFLNVVRGDMSIVGPRPHAVAAKAGPLLYQEAVKHYDARHRVKPGITGWAQVNGWRGETNTLEQIRKRVEHDLYYIDHWSVALDLRIIALTVVRGFGGSHVF